MGESKGLKLFLSFWSKGYIARVYRLDPCTGFYQGLLIVQRDQRCPASEERSGSTKKRQEEKAERGVKRLKHHQEHGSRKV